MTTVYGLLSPDVEPSTSQGMTSLCLGPCSGASGDAMAVFQDGSGEFWNRFFSARLPCWLAFLARPEVRARIRDLFGRVPAGLCLLIHDSHRARAQVLSSESSSGEVRSASHSECGALQTQAPPRASLNRGVAASRRASDSEPSCGPLGQRRQICASWFSFPAVRIPIAALYREALEDVSNPRLRPHRPRLLQVSF